MGFSKGLPSNVTCEQSSLERREKLQVAGCEIGRGGLSVVCGGCFLFEFVCCVCMWERVYLTNFHPAARKFTVAALQSNFEKNSARWCPDDNAVRKDEDNGPHPVMEFMLITMVISRQRGGLLLPRSTVTKVPPGLNLIYGSWIWHGTYHCHTPRIYVFYRSVSTWVSTDVRVDHKRILDHKPWWQKGWMYCIDRYMVTM